MSAKWTESLHIRCSRESPIQMLYLNMTRGLRVTCLKDMQETVSNLGGDLAPCSRAGVLVHFKQNPRTCLYLFLTRTWGQRLRIDVSPLGPSSPHLLSKQCGKGRRGRAKTSKEPTARDTPPSQSPAPQGRSLLMSSVLDGVRPGGDFPVGRRSEYQPSQSSL